MPERYLEQLNRADRIRHRLQQIITVLSFAVILGVFWSLKLTGIGVAGDAFCGYQEHYHTEECQQMTLICTLEEGVMLAEGTPDEADPGHTHTEACYELTKECEIQEHIHVENCYSDISADLETADDWEAPLADLVRGPTVKENMILIAQSQLGQGESSLNFHVDAHMVRRGITRYGQWYGNPYGDWSAMFVAFCLEYAGAGDVPTNAGPESMRLEWEEAGLYVPATEASPEPGNLVFIQKGESGQSVIVGIIVAVDENEITTIEGDLNNVVAEARYKLDEPAILGYGLTPENKPPMMLAPAPNAPDYTIWLDGTDGGLEYLTGSPNTKYTVKGGSIMQLPDSWTSPSKYSYKLRGWYDIVNHQYYPAGGEMEVTGNTVLYADWVAATYDIGVFNAHVSDTASTASFITTHLFDFNYLFNIQSTKPSITVNANSHSETWSMVSSGTVGFRNQQTFDFIFSDNDGEGRLCIPNNRDDENRYHEADTVTSGIYTAALGDRLFSTDNAFNPETGEGILGKTYLGTGDHLFQLMENPNDEHYGFYYYDSKHNAASFNQSAGRFYVYDYLSATSDSIGGAYSDFLPLNSPYTNTNGKTVGTYNYDGVDNEYKGVPHYRYDSKYNSGDYNSTNNVYTDYAYGMRNDIIFYLPNDPGTGGNKDLNGNNIQFYFSGDDDLWVLVDGVVVLDIGGIHQAVNGIVDFSTGEVTVNGVRQKSLMDLGITAGDHTLTVLYLERGASMSNCSIYFNLAPRFALELQKEDVLTQELLNGAQFTVYEDLECTNPAELWESEEAYNLDFADGVLNQHQSTFTVENGIAKLWGLGAGNTYYIKETHAPSKEGYKLAEGVIRLTLDSSGIATYQVAVIPDAQGNEPSNGFTVHGESIDNETKTLSLAVTNAPSSVVETTTVQVIKQWQDNKDHSGDYIQAYLTVTDPDGSVRRIREVTLGDENDWMYLWTNLPKYDYDNMTEVQYGIEESYESGYYSTVRKITHIEISKTVWAEALSFQNGETYILRTANGYLSTLDDRADTGYKWVDEQTAKNSPNALWTVTVKNNTVKFTNGKNQTITFYYNNGSPTDFFATSDPPNQQSRQEFMYSTRNGALQFYYQQGRNNYYLANSMNSSNKFGYNTNANSSLLFTPIKRVEQTDLREFEDWAYQITNTPLAANNETSLSVQKNWVIPEGYNATLYEQFSVTVRLLANGVNTGRTVTLNLKNGWKGSFLGLPYKDEAGNVIQYTAEEVWSRENWSIVYSDVKTSGRDPATYSVVITNTYHPGGPELPATGSAARSLYVLCGWVLMLAPLVYGIVSRRKREREIC